MKFDVVLSNPPFRVREKGWLKHVYKHLELLDRHAYYTLIVPADTSEETIRKICARFETITVKKVEHFDGLYGLDEKVRYFIWKK